MERASDGNKPGEVYVDPAEAGQDDNSPEVNSGTEEPGPGYRKLMRDLLSSERAAVTRMRDRGELGDEAYRQVQHDLDLQQERLED